MTLFLSAFLNLNEETNERDLETTLVKCMFDQLSDQDWIHHSHEEGRHWFKFTPEVLNQLDVSQDPELIELVTELKASNFEKYGACCHCGQVVFNYPSVSYRSYHHCTGRYLECSDCQGLNNEGVNELSRIRQTFGTGAAVHRLLTHYYLPEACEVTAFLPEDDSTRESHLLKALCDKHPEVLKDGMIHFNSSLLTKLKVDDSSLNSFKRGLLETEFNAHPHCDICGQVLFNYDEIQLRQVGDYVHREHVCLDCKPASDRKRDLIYIAYHEADLVGLAAHQAADRQIEAAREVDVLAPWTPVCVKDYHVGFFAIGNDANLEEGAIFNGNDLTLNYYVVRGESLAEAKYRIEQGLCDEEGYDELVLWSELHPWDGFVEPDESFVPPVLTKEETPTAWDANASDLPF